MLDLNNKNGDFVHLQIDYLAGQKNMIIYLNEILNLKESEYADWTLCLNNANKEQVYFFEENKTRLIEHISWKKHSNSNTSFRTIPTKYCLHFLRLDRDQKLNQLLFLGTFENCGINKYDDGHETYKLQHIDRFSHFAERLIVEFSKKQGPKQAKINISNIETMPVISILKKNIFTSINLLRDTIKYLYLLRN